MLLARTRRSDFINASGIEVPKKGRMASLAEGVIGNRRRPALPERISRDIARQQEAGEIIVSWTQAGLIAFFATLYAISPKSFSASTPFQPVPWTLAIYALFTAGRLVLAYRGRLSRGFVALSVVVDISVLMTTIWSFFLQYRAPPALYLKAPTLLYVFIFIALRTLRFEPGFVLLAGGCAALGWLGLLLYAVWGPEFAGFTHSYVAYATTYQILLGAEIDKVISILVVTLILALSLARGRQLLARSVAGESAASDLSRFFAPEVAAQIRLAEGDAASVRCEGCHAAILITDLRGFTALSHGRSADELIGLLVEYQSRLVPIIHRHGGSIDKYLGDGILASFGAIVPNATYAADLCRAIDDLADSAGAWQREREARGLAAPAVGMAGAVGDIVFGTVGHATRLEYTVIGEVVNLVAKLEKQTKSEGVRALMTGESYALALEQGYRANRPAEQRPGRKVEGVSDPVDVVVRA
ncbi:MAG TPA: adenylate/guanylate cyclase domain-containing protein, partial [Stellaceae bacterium]|nr:adenylate/guanylate cyclase domain-containing protein [Stellaceae bacterium]